MNERASLPAVRPKQKLCVAGGCALAVLSCALAATVIAPPGPRLVWNASASAPPGLYLVGNPDAAVVGEMAIARVPERWRGLAAVRRYLPANVPLVKRVAAGPGDTICARGRWIHVNGRRVAERRPVDKSGLPLPWWSGCTRLRAGALFLLMDDPASFDGRYFGPTMHGDIIGRAWLLWRA